MVAVGKLSSFRSSFVGKLLGYQEVVVHNNDDENTDKNSSQKNDEIGKTSNEELSLFNSGIVWVILPITEWLVYEFYSKENQLNLKHCGVFSWNFMISLAYFLIFGIRTVTISAWYLPWLQWSFPDDDDKELRSDHVIAQQIAD